MPKSLIRRKNLPEVARKGGGEPTKRPFFQLSFGVEVSPLEIKERHRARISIIIHPYSRQQPPPRHFPEGTVVEVEPVHIDEPAHLILPKKAGAPEEAPRPAVETARGIAGTLCAVARNFKRVRREGAARPFPLPGFAAVAVRAAVCVEARLKADAIRNLGGDDGGARASVKG